MSITQITDKVNELSSNWEQFKVLNDQKLKEIEKKGSADPLTLIQIEKLNNAIDNYQHSLNRIETAMHRPNSDVKNEPLPYAAKEHKAAFLSYIRKGIETNLIEMEKKTLSTSDNADGGYLISRPMADMLQQSLLEASPMRQIASVVAVSVDSLELLEDDNKANAGWVEETAARPDTVAPKISKKTITVHELYAQPKATQKLLDDASIDVEAWLVSRIVNTFAKVENYAFINGNGKGKPRGILSYSADKIEQINSGIDGDVSADGVIKLFYSLKESYATHAKFLMNRATVQAIRMLKDTTNGRYLWQPSFKDNTPDTILGAEVVQSAEMQGLGKDNLAIAVADFKAAYQIVDRHSIRMLRDPFTDKPYVKFYTTKRVGGDVINFDAIKIQKLSV